MVENGGPLKCVCGGQESPKGICLNVPQGRILGPLLLLNGVLQRLCIRSSGLDWSRGVLQGCVLGPLV